MDHKEEENKDDRKEMRNLSIPLRLRDKPMPKEAQYVTSYRTANNEENAEKIIASNGKDRRKKYNKLEKVISEGDPVDIKKYIVQLTMRYGDTDYVGTATIIRIVNDTIFLLTAAHNVVELCEIEENKRFYADGIWFKLNDSEVSASKCHVYGKYTNKTKMGNDIAIIECKLKTPFMFNYHTFPSLLQICSVPICDKIGIFGYPGEKNGEFWGMSGNASFAINKSIISYDNIDTTGGQSGSPIFLEREGITVIAGVHTNGAAMLNYAAMLNAESVGWIDKLIPKQIIGNLIVRKNKTVTLKSNHQYEFDRVVIELLSKICIHRGSIADLRVDCIVNAANGGLWAGAGVCGDIFRAAGYDSLQRECDAITDKFGNIPTGESVITKGYKLYAQYIIHSVGPTSQNNAALQNCYMTALELCIQHNIRSIAFPCIGTETFGFSKHVAALLTLKTVRAWLILAKKTKYKDYMKRIEQRQKLKIQEAIKRKKNRYRYRGSYGDDDDSDNDDDDDNDDMVEDDKNKNTKGGDNDDNMTKKDKKEIKDKNKMNEDEQKGGDNDNNNNGDKQNDDDDETVFDRIDDIVFCCYDIGNWHLYEDKTPIIFPSTDDEHSYLWRDKLKAKKKAKN